MIKMMMSPLITKSSSTNICALLLSLSDSLLQNFCLIPFEMQVHLELLYCPFGTENQILNPFSSTVLLTEVEKALKDTSEDDVSDIERKTTEKKHEVILRGVLSVTVVSAENLPVMDLIGKSDPYVVVTLKKAGAKMKTRVSSPLCLLCLRCIPSYEA